MDVSTPISFVMATAAGFLSFLSPCVLPLLPSYVSFTTGISFDDLTQGSDRGAVKRATALHSLSFILGFSLVFVTLGASATYAGQFMNQHMDILRKIGGVIVIILGLHFAGWIRLDFLQKGKKWHLKEKPLGYAGSVLVGASFGLGWTPCIGPILGSILMYAATTQNLAHGTFLLAAYSIGLAVPFFTASLAFNSFLSTFKKIGPYMRIITIVSGLLLIGMGFLIYTNNLAILSQYVTNWLSE
jgi:cytochrome c-type biogenesis protein